MKTREDPSPRAVPPVVVLWSIIGFWLLFVAIVTLRAAVSGFPEQLAMAQRRGVVTVVGIALTWLLYLVIRRFDGRPIATRIAVACLAAVPCSIAVAMFNYYVFFLYDPLILFDEAERVAQTLKGGMLQDVAEQSISRYFFFAAWAAKKK